MRVRCLAESEGEVLQGVQRGPVIGEQAAASLAQNLHKQERSTSRTIQLRRL